MMIDYTKFNPRYYMREVYSKEHDECLAKLEILKELGIVSDITKSYSENGWDLAAGVIRYRNEIGYHYSGTWEEVGEEIEIPKPIFKLTEQN